ncbi:MAG: EamA family transporter [Comamonadaceae bacterium]|nr:MAG: EamA family transporter [Comamonadaceae bacterium]
MTASSTPAATSPIPRPHALRAVLMMIGAAGCFVANDALAKYLSQSLPAAQLIFLRSAIVVLLMLLLAWRQGVVRQLPQAANPRVIVRSLTDAFGTAMYLLSLFQLPLANATAINQGAPLFMTLFAVLFLHEKASALRWAAVFIGFVGVLLVVRPTGDGFNAWALLCLAGTLLHALRDLFTRRLDPKLPSLVATLSSAVALGLLAALLLPFQGWTPIDLPTLGLITLGAAFLCGAFLLLIGGLRLGEISLLAPFRYSGLLFAVLLGYAVWGHLPDAWGAAGLALLLLAGLMAARSGTARAQP